MSFCANKLSGLALVAVLPTRRTTWLDSSPPIETEGIVSVCSHDGFLTSLLNVSICSSENAVFVDDVWWSASKLSLSWMSS